MKEKDYATLARKRKETIRRMTAELSEANTEIRALQRALRAKDKLIDDLRKAAEAEKNLNARVAVLEFAPVQKRHQLRDVQGASRKANHYRKKIA